MKSLLEAAAKLSHAAYPAIVVIRFALHISPCLGMRQDEEAALENPFDNAVGDTRLGRCHAHPR